MYMSFHLRYSDQFFLLLQQFHFYSVVLKICRSKDFRTAFTELAGIQALVLPNTPLMACTATATPGVDLQ